MSWKNYVLSYHFTHPAYKLIQRSCPPLPFTSHPCVLYYVLLVWLHFPCFPFHFVSQRGCGFGGNAANSYCRETSPYFMLRQSWALLKDDSPHCIDFPALFFVRKLDSGVRRHDCVNCTHLPDICRVLSVLQVQILDPTSFLIEKM